MKKIRQILIGLFNMVYNIFLRYSQAVLLVIVVIVSTDVFCRNVLSYSIKWAQEVSLLLIVWMTFLSMASFMPMLVALMRISDCRQRSEMLSSPSRTKSSSACGKRLRSGPIIAIAIGSSMNL